MRQIHRSLWYLRARGPSSTSEKGRTKKILTMLKEPVMFETVDLPNGLTVEFYDYSRKLAGDRWLVGLLVKIPMKVTRQDFEGFNEPDGLFEKFISQNGEEVSFQLKKERNFIDEKEKDEVFSQILENLKKHALSYMGHKDFSAGFKKKKIKEFEERLTWWQ